MRIFNVNRRINFDGQEILDSLNCNLNIAEVKVIVKSLEKFKSDDLVLVSNKDNLLAYLKNYYHE